MGLFALAACSDPVPPIVAPSDGGAVMLPDGRVVPAPDDGAVPPPDGGPPPRPEELTIRFVRPTGDVSVHNALQGELEVGGGPELVELILDDVGGDTFDVTRTLLPPYAFSEDLTALADGTRLTIRGRAVRGAEEVTTAPITVTIDESLPIDVFAVMTAPDSGTVVDAEVRLQGALRGPSTVGTMLPEIREVEWLVDGAVSSMPSGCENSTWQSVRLCRVTWNTSAVAAGRHDVAIRFLLREGGDITSPPIGIVVVHETVNPAFERLGTGLAIPASPDSYEHDMAIDGRGRPVVAYRADSRIRVRRWDPESGTFVALGDSLSSGGSPLWPRVTIAPGDMPIVTWTQATTSVTVQTRRFDGASWVALGGGMTSDLGGIASQYSIAAIDPARGQPVVAWLDERREGGARVTRTWVARWSGSAWAAIGESLGSELPMPTYVAPSSLWIAPDGTPWIAYADAASTTDTTYVRRLREGTWETVGSVSPVRPSGNGRLHTSMGSARDGTLYLAGYMPAGGVSVFRSEGGAFAQLGTTIALPVIPGAAITYGPPYLVVDSSGRPVVAFSTSLGGRAFRWDGAAWAAIGSGHLEDSLSASGVVGLAIDGSDRLYVLVGEGDGSRLRNLAVKTHALR